MNILFVFLLNFKVILLVICDLMGQNQSHVAIFPYGAKYTSFWATFSASNS